ncbi:MAG: hypothetical protein ACREEQ_00105 [Caulobacteraceae bacterium]
MKGFGCAAALGAGVLLCASPVLAAPPEAPTAASNPVSDYFAHWMDRVEQAQSTQPHWMTPVVTVTPRLEQEFRFDFGFQGAGDGSHLDNYGAGKGVELIPTTSNEILVNVPPYEVRSGARAAAGFGDDTVLMVKQRFLSANEQEGNYILTGFLAIQAPVGSKAFTNHAWVVTPTLAGGKGWGDFDIQATVGLALPTARAHAIGDSLATNVAFQYHFAQVFWPELELNDTYWMGGERGGLNQLYVTPGVVFGRFPIAGRINAIVGVGYQIAVSPRLRRTPALTPIYDRQFILTTRMSF